MSTQETSRLSPLRDLIAAVVEGTKAGETKPTEFKLLKKTAEMILGRKITPADEETLRTFN